MRIMSIIPKLHHELTLLSPRHSHLQQSQEVITTVTLLLKFYFYFKKLHEATFILKKRFKKERQRCQRAEVNGPASRLHRSRTLSLVLSSREKHQEDGCGSPGHTATCASRFPHEVKNLKDLELLNKYFRLFILQVIPTLSTDLKSW